MTSYVAICRRLASIGASIGLSPKKELVRGNTRSRLISNALHLESASEKLENDLRLANVRLLPEDVQVAGRALTALIFATMLAVWPIVILSTGTEYVFPLVAMTTVIPVLAGKLLVSHPAKLAARRADRIFKRSSEAANLMIMSLRHEPSIPIALAFASARNDDFSTELRSCTWNVIMGKYESFEEALMNLGHKWDSLGTDLKTCLNSMVTSSREATQDGRRRALDRANQAMIAGGKRRIEEYALSLAVPSMLIFGLGILLPLMVGSFLPMLSWNLWSMDDISHNGNLQTQSQSTSQMVFIMNILFPAIALLVAVSAVSNHPLGSDAEAATGGRLVWAGGLVALGVAGVLFFTIWFAVDESELKSVCLLFSAILPLSLWLLAKSKSSPTGRDQPVQELEDVLFRTGSRMLEGENFESSFHRATKDLGGKKSDAVRRLSVRGVLATRDAGEEPFSADSTFGMRNAAQGIRITREAASKDEVAAGMLAMDLASYLKDLRDLEFTLRNRLKPTISMMKTTALVLAPIVMGVTYAIYLSLASLLGGGNTVSASIFFLVLGVFLAQMDAVVVYFMWGIDGKRGFSRLAGAAGSYFIVSELTYSATALLVSA